MASVAGQNIAPKRKGSLTNWDREGERDKVASAIAQFYGKISTKIEKALAKESKRASLLCKQIFVSLEAHPQQEPYEMARMTDWLFAETEKVTELVSEWVGQLQNLREQMNSQLKAIQQKNQRKQETIENGQAHISALRKISMQQSTKLVSIDTLNRKLLKLQESEEGEFCLQVEGSNRLECSVKKYGKVWFPKKKKEYLLCVAGSGHQAGQLILVNDQLQPLAKFTHIKPLPLQSTKSILQLKHYVYLIETHKITRINLLNQNDVISTVVHHGIVGAQINPDGLILWLQQIVLGPISLEMLNSELKTYWRCPLKACYKSVVKHFTIKQEVYCLVSKTGGGLDLLKLQDCDMTTVIKDLTDIVEVISIRTPPITDHILFRTHRNRFLRLDSNSPQLMGLWVQLGSQVLRKCAVLGQHLYGLTQTGKQLLECHCQTDRL